MAAVAVSSASDKGGCVKLDHICIGVNKLQDIEPFLVPRLGGKFFEGGPGLGFTGCQWRFANGGTLESLEPLGDDGFLHRFLARRGPGIHHVTFKVPKIEEMKARAESFGYEIIGYSTIVPTWKEFFLFPKQALGIVVQFAEAHPPEEPEPEGSWGASFAFPFKHSQPAPAPVSVLGLRLVCRSREAAQKQWGALIGGAASATREGLLFRFPESPMYIRVDVDPAAKEDGPLWIEVASQDGEPVALDAARFPAFAPLFRQVDPATLALAPRADAAKL